MKTVKLSIQGGRLDVDSLPDGIQLQVKEYDIEGYMASGKDEIGDYVYTTYEN